MDWTKVVTHPLGLAGFALSLVFMILRNRKGMPPWWPAAAIMLAAACVVGGLALSYAGTADDGPAGQHAEAGDGGTAVNVRGENIKIEIGK